MSSKPLLSFDEIAEESPFFLAPEERPDWPALFDNDHPLMLEIGFGNGKFLIEMAAREPGCNFIGLDFYHRGIRKIVSRIEKLQMANVRIVYGDAREKVPFIFNPGELAGVYINFPDPWPKKRHIKRRLIKPAFLKVLAEKLKGGGLLRLATDSEPYAREMLDYLEADLAFRNNCGPCAFREERDDLPMTKYENNFIKAGERIYYLDFTRE
ncbi:MAG: tRNA (guanosine(46)-N7)-methyltransferase TrmB [Nitrospinaceae bacterium]|nr:MAG: tRNA (guanosine(46)-N7)-methyltransferase TrmB [Nitrospinaceae bacterium]